MSKVVITPEALTSLAEKIEGLELTAAEHAALRAILDRAEAYEPEVEGFGMESVSYSGTVSGSGLVSGALTLAVSGGFVRLPGLDSATMDHGGGWPPRP